jgi:hypothetical protein
MHTFYEQSVDAYVLERKHWNTLRTHQEHISASLSMSKVSMRMFSNGKTVSVCVFVCVCVCVCTLKTLSEHIRNTSVPHFL